MNTRIGRAGLAALAGLALSGAQLLDLGGPLTEMSPPELVLPPPVEGEIPSIAEDIGLGESDPAHAEDSLMQIVRICLSGERTPDELESLRERYGRFYREVRAAQVAFQEEAATASENTARETSAERYRHFADVLDGLPHPDAFKCPDPVWQRYWSEHTLEGALAAQHARADAELLREGAFDLDPACRELADRIAREDAELMREGAFDLDRTSTTFLDLHNQARAEVGVQPLQWDPALAASAKAYAIKLTNAGQLVHSSREGRKNVRENLLQNLPGGRTPTQMIGVWTAEKALFKPGTFPDVSTTGNWSDIGHYTQMIWETTTHVGCATNGDARFDWLVCHYSPPGTKDCKPVGMASMPRPRHVVASQVGRCP